MHALHWMIIIVVVAGLSNGPDGTAEEVAPTADATPTAVEEQTPSLAEKFITAFKDPVAGRNFYAVMSELDQQFQTGDKPAEESAQELLQSKAELVTDEEVTKVLDALVEQGKVPLAANLLLQIARAKSVAKGYPSAHVVAGRLVVGDEKTDPTMVMAQMPILAEGYFAGEVGDLTKPIAFRFHGYQNLDVPLAEKEGDVIYLGEVKLEPIAAGEGALLKGKVKLDAAPDAKPAVLNLRMGVGPVNTPHGGYSPRRSWPDAFTVPVSETGEFEIDGLSGSDYYVSATADGHVDLNKKLTFTAGEELDAGELRLFSSDLGFYVGTPVPPSEELVWEKDYQTALARATAEKKPLLVMMTATWCGPCKMLEAQTLNDPWIRYFLSPFVLVKAYEDRDVEKTYGLRGYPTLVFASSTGKAAHTSVGFMPTFPFSAENAKAYKALSLDLPPEMQTLVDKKIINVE